MKKSLIVFLGVFSIFLIACSTKTSSLGELQQQYTAEMQTTFSVVTEKLIKAESEGETTHQFVINSREKSSLQGEIAYTSTSQKDALDNELSDMLFSINIHNTNKTETPILSSGDARVFYNDGDLLFYIKDFSLFMGEGNSEAAFINLFAKDLSHRRLALDNPQKFGLQIVDTMDTSLLLSSVQTLVSLDSFSFSEDKEQKNSSFEASVAENTKYTKALSLGLSSLQDLGLLPTEEGAINLSKATVILENKKSPILAIKNIIYQTTEQDFSLEISASKDMLKLAAYDTILSSEGEISDQKEYFTITLYLKEDNQLAFEIVKKEEKTQVLNISATLTSKLEGETTVLEYSATFTIAPLQLEKGEQIAGEMKGIKTFTPKNIENIHIEGDILHLSELLGT
ncbi:MAG: hypothetical protein PHU61_00260 [Candidatus Absconditabacteria bacterium]|nr:hypothetical protein [Candidatus Absconditabacteria bacterium]MDD3868639.1 hypothetical protein [Candidatus Absconditabacteria bacterium]MDD4714159.1 hypothetical protein [Candidatus Absconditabacteria bacterium]